MGKVVQNGWEVLVGDTVTGCCYSGEREAGSPFIGGGGMRSLRARRACESERVVALPVCVCVCVCVLRARVG